MSWYEIKEFLLVLPYIASIGAIAIYIAKLFIEKQEQNQQKSLQQKNINNLIIHRMIEEFNESEEEFNHGYNMEDGVNLFF